MSNPVNREPNETNRQGDEEDIPGPRIAIVHRDEQRAGDCKPAKHTGTAGMRIDTTGIVNLSSLVSSFAFDGFDDGTMENGWCVGEKG